MDPKKYYTSAQAAAALGVTVGRVWQLIAAGQIAALRFGKQLAIPIGEIAKAKRRKTKPGPAGKKARKGKGAGKR